MAINKKFMIVDDEPVNLEILEAAFSEDDLLNQYEMLYFQDPIEALDVAISSKIDIIILDLLMPKLSGIDFLKKYYEKIDQERASVIVITGKDDSSTLEECLSLGASDFVSKPFDPVAIISRVKNQIEKKQLLENALKEVQHKQTLFRVLKHDVNNLVAVGILNLSLFQKKSDSKFLDRTLATLESIQSVVKNLAKIEVLNFNQSFEFSPVNVQQILDKLKFIYSEKIKEKDLDFQVNVPQQEIFIFADEVILTHQILGNILSNAIKFTPKQGKINIDVELSADEQKVLISISDSGIGIPQKIKKELFDWRSQTHRKGTEGESGTGFGMPVMKNFVDQIGGQISIETPIYDIDTNKEHGTKFILTLARHQI